MLRVGLPIILLAGWTVATPVARSVADEQMPTLTIKGSVTYAAGAALPPGSRAVIELRHLPALPDAPAVADQRIDLEGKQSPVPFEFTLERYKLVGVAMYFVRGAIVSEKRAIWTSDDIKIDVTQSTVDVKEVTLRPVMAGAPVLDSVPRGLTEPPRRPPVPRRQCRWLAASSDASPGAPSALVRPCRLPMSPPPSVPPLACGWPP